MPVHPRELLLVEHARGWNDVIKRKPLRELLGNDRPAPGDYKPVPIMEKKAQKVDKSGKPLFERPSWRHDGATGLDKALMNHYDVVIVDRDLPRIHGDAVCAALVGAATPARILMLTAAGAKPYWEM